MIADQPAAPANACSAAGSPPPRGRLLLALALPTALGWLGAHVLDSLPATFWLYLLGGCAVLPAMLVGARPGRPGGLPWSPAPDARWRRLWLPLSVVFGPLFLGVYAVLRPALGDVSAYRLRVEALGISLDEPLVAGLLFLALNPLLEEWWWRAQATPRCVAAFGPGRGLLLATAGFGVYHVALLGALFPWPVAILRAALISLAGLLWSWLALQQRSWRDVYLAHLIADIAMAILFAVMILP